MKFVATCLTPEAVKEKLVAEITVSQFEECFPYLHNRRGNNKNASTSEINKKKTTISATVLTKLCIVRGISSRTSTRSSSPTRGVMSVSQSVNLFRLQNRQKGENLIHLNKHVCSPLTKAGALFLNTTPSPDNGCLKVHDTILPDPASRPLRFQVNNKQQTNKH